MDDIEKSLQKANKRAIESMRASQDAPESEDEVSHSEGGLLTAEKLQALVKPAKGEYGDGTPVVGHESLPQNMSQVLQFLAEHRLKNPDDDKGVARDLIDDTLLKMRSRGVSERAVAKRLGMTLEQVIERQSALLSRQASMMTSSEYRQLQIIRLEEIVNALWSHVEYGDSDQTKNILVAIERLNKMFELESEKSVIEVNIVTDAQSKLIIAATLRVLEKVLSLPQVAALGIEQRVIDEVTFEALEEAGKAVQTAAENPLKIDKKELTT